MRSKSRLELLAAVFVLGFISTVVGQQPPRQGGGRLQLEPLGAKNEAVFPYFEGWHGNDDGTATILLGYYNRNTDQTLDVPIGPNNRIEPGGPDRGQPTHFLPRRQYGVFTITVPKDSKERFTWTLTANNLTNAVTVWLNPQYFVEPFRNAANGNTPPKIKFVDTGPVLQGPPRVPPPTIQATVNQPVSLTLWASDAPATYDAATNRFMTLEEVAARRAKDAAEGGGAGRGGRGGAAAGGAGDSGAAGAAGGRGGASADPGSVAIINGQVISMSGAGARGAAALAASRGGAGPSGDVNITWTKYRGPGEVTFAQTRVPVQLKGNFSTFQEAKTTATFNVPGEYWLRAVANDASGDGGGGDQCCWTTAHVKVIVK